MDQLEFEKKQMQDFVRLCGDKNYVYLVDREPAPQVFFINEGLGCRECKRRSCVAPERCIYAMVMSLKVANAMPKEVPWFEIRATRGDRIYIEDRRLRN